MFELRLVVLAIDRVIRGDSHGDGHCAAQTSGLAPFTLSENDVVSQLQTFIQPPGFRR